jgi:high-affinity iron transporter
MNSLSAALQSGSILLREGLEAMLIIAALAGFLHRAGAVHQLKALYVGAALAIVASLGMAAVFAVYFDGAHDDRIEAVILVIAAVLMLYMSGWLFLRQDPRAWNAEIRRSAERALSSGTLISLASISFLAVFREGGETVLFLYALAGTSGGWSFGLVAGLVGATACLVVLYVLMQWLAVRLPLRPVFLATSALLFVMGLRFIGGAVQEMQEQQIIPHDGVAMPDWIVSLGVNPSWEALGAQAVIALIAVASTLVLHFRRPGFAPAE